MRRTFVAILVCLAMLLVAGCGTTSNRQQNTVTLATIGAKAIVDVSIEQRCEAGQIKGDCAMVKAKARSLVDVLVADITARGEIDDATRTAARVGLADFLVEHAGLTRERAEVLVNTVGDLLVAAVRSREKP